MAIANLASCLESIPLQIRSKMKADLQNAIQGSIWVVLNYMDSTFTVALMLLAHCIGTVEIYLIKGTSMLKEQIDNEGTRIDNILNFATSL